MMTLRNDISIAAPRTSVWTALSRLDLLERYDPAVTSSRPTGEANGGLGAERRCEVRPRAWYVERVASWEPERALGVELVDCSLIDEGMAIVRECLRRNDLGPYQLQAAINAVHAAAGSVETTDWPRILAFYDLLLAVAPTAAERDFLGARARHG